MHIRWLALASQRSMCLIWTDAGWPPWLVLAPYTSCEGMTRSVIDGVCPRQSVVPCGG